jgi:FtsP/CotA-like multicopper oxidase with cupredoxin domain
MSNRRKIEARHRRVPRVIHAAAWTAAIALLLFATGSIIMLLRAQTTTAGALDFEQPLRIPPLLEPRTDPAGRKVFDLRLQSGRTELLPGRPAETWGVNGPHLGPTLRATRGDTVVMHVRNSLPEPTTLHWHGMHVPAHADGGPHQPVASEDRWTPSWTIDQSAATLWYHPHFTGETEDHVYRGLAGLFLVDDPAANGLTLPSEYGVDDIPLILQDKRLDDDGRLDFGQGPISPIGRLGNEILVNGTHDPHLDVSDRLVRLRLLKASTARIYNIGFADGRGFDLIGTDGGLLPMPRRVARVQLSVGERAEIVVELAAGENVVLRSFEPDLGMNPIEARFAGGDDTLDLLEIRPASKLDDSPESPRTLASSDRPETATADRVRRFELGSRDINDAKMDPARIDQVVELGDTEIWEVENVSGTAHNFHVHDVRFRVIEYAGGPPPPQLSGPKDTVYVPPGETVRLLTRFTDYVDPRTPYMFHCHILEHEDRGMMGQFVVVRPRAGSDRPADSVVTAVNGLG